MQNRYYTVSNCSFTSLQTKLINCAWSSNMCEKPKLLPPFSTYTKIRKGNNENTNQAGRMKLLFACATLDPGQLKVCAMHNSIAHHALLHTFKPFVNVSLPQTQPFHDAAILRTTKKSNSAKLFAFKILPRCTQKCCVHALNRIV